MSTLLIDMAEGKACFVCGDYFQVPNATVGEIYSHGYECACKHCYNNLPNSEKAYRVPAKVETIDEVIKNTGGVINDAKKLNAIMANEAENFNNQFGL